MAKEGTFQYCIRKYFLILHTHNFNGAVTPMHLVLCHTPKPLINIFYVLSLIIVVTANFDRQDAKMHVTANASNVRKLVPTCDVCRAHYLWQTNHSIFSFDSGVSSEDRVLHAWAIFRWRSRLDCLAFDLM